MKNVIGKLNDLVKNAKDDTWLSEYNSFVQNFNTEGSKIFEYLKEIYKDDDRVEVITGTVTADLAVEYGCVAIVKGLRSVTDFDYEIGMAHINKEISGGKVNTISFFADKEYQFLSSSVVRELAYLNKNTEKYVHENVQKRLVKKLGR